MTSRRNSENLATSGRWASGEQTVAPIARNYRSFLLGAPKKTMHSLCTLLEVLCWVKATRVLNNANTGAYNSLQGEL
jgi:hypothetical protein